MKLSEHLIEIMKIGSALVLIATEYDVVKAAPCDCTGSICQCGKVEKLRELERMYKEYAELGQSLL